MVLQAKAWFILSWLLASGAGVSLGCAMYFESKAEVVPRPLAQYEFDDTYADELFEAVLSAKDRFKRNVSIAMLFICLTLCAAMMWLVEFE